MGRLSGTRVLVALLLLPGLAGCSGFEPQPLDEPTLLRRAQSRIDGDVNVTVAPLSAKEARAVLGFDVERSGIQPLWVKVVNREPVRWFLPPITIDSDYFSPLEVAWQGHRAWACPASWSRSG